MKKVFALIVCFLFITTTAFAVVSGAGNTEVNNSSNSMSGAYANSASMSSGYAAAMQGQGQSADVSNSNSYSGGETKTNCYAVSNNTPAAMGTEAFSSFVTGWSDTSEYVMHSAYINSIIDAAAAGLCKDGEARITKELNNMRDSVKPNRVCGCLWKTRGKNLSNLMGLLSWPSFKKSDL